MCNAKVKFIKYKERQKDKVIYCVYIVRSTFFFSILKLNYKGRNQLQLIPFNLEISPNVLPPPYKTFGKALLCVIVMTQMSESKPSNRKGRRNDKLRFFIKS